MKPKLLVANRGEIACRVFQAAREWGIPSVGIVTEADLESRHVTMADEVILIQSYLDADEIVQAALKSKSTLIHPGYGFLSERPHFVRAVEKAGLVFLGPRAETMEALGDKIGSKKLAEQLKVPTLPWAMGSLDQFSDLEKKANAIGYPLLLKASSGGGGKGMRKVERASDLKSSAEGASREAKAAFGDATFFLEKLLVNPRHIEVQVFGNGDGSGIHLYERECSIQRRHQKIWEESPAPHLKDETKNGLFESALKLIQETKYRSAGTIEFLVDGAGKFYFLEMNTRLQVEHAVTELVTGMDLVSMQLAGALKEYASETRFEQEAVHQRGASIEVRLYAEDPSQGFAPSPGKIERLRWPVGVGIRVDSGIEEGQTMGTGFDPMFAKLIVSAPSRASAIARLRYALDETVVLGMPHNLGFLRFLCDHPKVMGGQTHTQMMEELLKDYSSRSVSPEILRVLGFLKASSVGGPATPPHLTSHGGPSAFDYFGRT